MAESSRKGKKIARRACDLCRDRRVLCAFDGETSSSCRQCQRLGVLCTFLTERKPRGPPSRLAAEARERTQAATRPAGPGPLPLGQVNVAHFVPESTFLTILDDFVLRVYPVLPLVHVPSFTAALRRRDFETDPAFFRLCISLCAVTVASIPRKVADCYGSSWYNNAGEMVDRASHVVLLSRLATVPTWQNDATVDSMIVSIVLTMASHYAARHNAGWAYASEAVHFFREMGLYQEAAYRGLDVIQRELCKRAFWLLFVVQIHDRMSFTIPHTGLSYDPQHTDWEYLLPLEASDDELADGSLHSGARSRRTAVISGFIALIKVFLCIVDLLDKSFPGPPPYFGLSGTHAPRMPEVLDANHASSQARPELPVLESLFQVMTRLDVTLSDLPEPLSLHSRRSRTSQSHDEPGCAESAQFDIMRANIHITAIYIQSLILEMCLNRLQRDRLGAAAADASTPPQSPLSSQLWQMKETVARKLLDILNCSSASVLESNGSSMIKKIREIAATFLEQDRGVSGDTEMDSIERRSRDYIGRFVEILAELDYAART